MLAAHSLCNANDEVNINKILQRVQSLEEKVKRLEKENKKLKEVVAEEKGGK